MEEKIALLKELIPSKYSDVEVLDKGKHGIVFKANSDKEVVAIKMKHPNSESQNTAILEATYLEKVNLLGIGPKLIEKNENYVVMEFIEGIRIDKFLLEASEENIKLVMIQVLEQMKKLDEAGINKMEMTNPYKHIIVRTLEPVLIDFERARFSPKSKNVNQFKEYLKKNQINI